MNSILTVNDVLEIGLNDPVAATRWDELVTRSPQSDVYYRAAYVLAAAELEHSEPLGLIISSSNRRYLLPMLLRPISSPDGQSWSDASTPYGYGGVLCSSLDSEVALPDVLEFLQGCSLGARRESWFPASSAPIPCLRRIGCSLRLRALISFSSSGAAKPWPCLFNFGMTLGNARSECRRGAVPT